MGALKRLLVNTLKFFNLRYIKPAKDPRKTLLGIRSLDINTIIDVGANVGQFSGEISRFFPDASFYCFEPLPSAYRKLERWGKTVNAKTFNCALGEMEGSLEMNLHNIHDTSSSLLETTDINDTLFPETSKQNKVSVAVRTLDSILDDRKQNLERDILVKLDVQGYEDRVIRGGRSVLSLAKAVILEVCIEKLYGEQAGFLEILSLMEGLGFYYAGNLEQFYREDTGRVIYIDAVFLRRDDE